MITHHPCRPAKLALHVDWRSPPNIGCRPQITSPQQLSPATLARPGLRSHEWSRAMPNPNSRHRRRSVTRPHVTVSVSARAQSTSDWYIKLGHRIQVNHNGCWLTNTNPATYTRITVYGKEIQAHRAIYSLFHDDFDIDSDLYVHHTYLTPACVNPDHLEVMTPKEHQVEHDRLAAEHP